MRNCEWAILAVKNMLPKNEQHFPAREARGGAIGSNAQYHCTASHLRIVHSLDRFSLLECAHDQFIFVMITILFLIHLRQVRVDAMPSTFGVYVRHTVSRCVHPICAQLPGIHIEIWFVRHVLELEQFLLHLRMIERRTKARSHTNTIRTHTQTLPTGVKDTVDCQKCWRQRPHTAQWAYKIHEDRMRLHRE